MSKAVRVCLQLCLCLKLIAPAVLRAEEVYFEDPARLRQNVWSFGLSGVHYNYVNGEHRLVGKGGVFEFGYGKFQERLKYLLTAEVLFGPYGPIRNERVKTDFFGTGLKFRTAFALGTYRKAAAATTWDLGLGLNYYDMVGRSVESAKLSGRSVRDLTMRITNFSMLASVGYNFILPARRLGNAPENLPTRVEGYSVIFEGSYPIRHVQTTKYREIVVEADGSTTSRRPTERGNLNGFALILTCVMYLGV